jgi:2-amino-4-hydroxy-6-hydroxymethyldihydropteridine diphosphokinase
LIFGSNQGDRAALIDRAIARAAIIGAEERRSSLYESDPWGFTADTPFYNRVVSYRTPLSPTAVLQHCLEIERQMGRTRDASRHDTSRCDTSHHDTSRHDASHDTSRRYTSRSIDIDILFHDDQVIQLPDLVIPHPRIAERRFVLLPLAEIFPALVHPVLHETISMLLERCTDGGKVTAPRA